MRRWGINNLMGVRLEISARRCEVRKMKIPLFGKCGLRVAGGMLAVLLAVMGGVHGASTLLEFDFQTAGPEGNTVKAAEVVAGASGMGKYDGTTVFDPNGATGLKGKGVEKGYLEFPDGSDGYLEMINTDAKGNNAEYRDYEGKEGFGTGTMVIVFQPGASYDGKKGGNRKFFFTTNMSGTSNAIARWLASDGGSKLRLEFAANKEGYSMVEMELPPWDPTAWYVMGASWGMDKKPTMYVRKIGSGEGKFAMGSKELTVTEMNVLGIRFGNAPYNASQKVTPAGGKMAYVLWTEEYTESKEAFEAMAGKIAEK